MSDPVYNTRSRTIDVHTARANRSHGGRPLAGAHIALPDAIRVPVMAGGPGRGYRQIAPAWYVTCRNDEAMRFFERKLAEFMRSLDGICIDPENNP